MALETKSPQRLWAGKQPHSQTHPRSPSKHRRPRTTQVGLLAHRNQQRRCFVLSSYVRADLSRQQQTAKALCISSSGSSLQITFYLFWKRTQYQLLSWTISFNVRELHVNNFLGISAPGIFIFIVQIVDVNRSENGALCLALPTPPRLSPSQPSSHALEGGERRAHTYTGNPHAALTKNLAFYCLLLRQMMPMGPSVSTAHAHNKCPLCTDH